MINSRDIEALDVEVRPICYAHVRLCRETYDIELLVTATWRDDEYQDWLYALGRTRQVDQRIVTNARAWQSWHQYRVAWDVVPLIGGKAAWDDPVLWKRVIECGKSAGAEAGADWKKFPDRPHFQKLPSPAMTLPQAEKLFRANGTIW